MSSWASQGEQDAANAMDAGECLDVCDRAYAAGFRECRAALVAMLVAEDAEPGNDESADEAERARNLAAWRDGWASYAARDVLDSRANRAEREREERIAGPFACFSSKEY